MSTSQQPANQANNCREDDPQDLYHDPPTGLGSEAHTTQRLVLAYVLRLSYNECANSPR